MVVQRYFHDDDAEACSDDETMVQTIGTTASVNRPMASPRESEPTRLRSTGGPVDQRPRARDARAPSELRD
eukprot:9501572-Pyramimonas_sp.AAC.1